MNVTILYGGRSGEHEVSLVSGATVARNISKEHNVTLIGVTKDGSWYKQPSSALEEIRKNPEAKLSIVTDRDMIVRVTPGGGKAKALRASGEYIPCDVVFPVMHGTYSEDGTIQGLLELADLPYVGCNVVSSAATMDKEITKILWASQGLPVVPYVCVTRNDVYDSKKYDALVQKAIDTFGFPLFVKPCCAGSSDGASKADNEKELSQALLEAFMWDNKVLIEKGIDAREIECSVTGNSITGNPEKEFTSLKVYGPGEIVPKHEFYDYDAKYNDPDGAELKMPALLEEDKLNWIRETAIKAYRIANCSGLSRVDFFIDRKTDTIYLNEINTLPGFTGISMFPKLCVLSGMTFEELVELLLNEAIEAYFEKAKLCTSR